MADDEEVCFPRGCPPKGTTSISKISVKQVPEGLFKEAYVKQDEKAKNVNHQKRKQISNVECLSELCKILDMDVPYKKHKMVEYLQFKTITDRFLPTTAGQSVVAMATNVESDKKGTQDGVLLCRPEVERRTVKRVRQDSEMSTSSVISVCAQEFGDLEIGEEVEVTVRSIKPTCAIVHIPSHRTADGRPLTGRIHASEVVDCPEHNSKPLRRLKVGQALLCHVIGCRDVRTCKFLEITNRKAVKGIVELSLRRSFFDESNDGNMSRDRFDTGSQVVGFVKSYDKVHEQLTVEVLPGIRGVIEKLLISGNLGQKIKPSVHVGRAYHCTVLQDDGVHLKLASKGVHINGMTGNDVTRIEVGCITNGVVEKVLNDGLLIRTEFKGHGKAFTTDLFDEMFDSPLKEFTEGQIVRCRVLECENRCKMKLSLRKSLMHVGSEISNDDVMKSLKQKQVVKGYVNGCTKEGVFITLSRHLHGRVTFEHATKYHCDVIQAQKVLYIGKLVTSYVLSVSPQGDRIELSLLPEHVGEKDLFDQVASSLSWKRSSNGDVDYVTASKKRRVMLEKCSKSNVERSIHNASVKNEDVKTISTAIAEESAAEPGFIWDDNDDVKRSVDSSDEDSGIEDQKVDLKLTKREKAELAVREESELRRKEVELLDETKTPESAAEWERILAANPDNSMIWIRYIAFHLHATEIEKARAVAEKALKTINFREEKEKFNVWVSLLNLENLYGSDDTMEEVTRRALEQNDQLKVLNHLVSLYVQSGKNDKAEEVHQKLLKRYRGNKDVWLAYMKYLMEQDKHQEAQEIMKRSVKSLDRKHHLEIISKFAQMEFVFGDAERGRTMFENTISSYPKRTDVWSIYIDTLLKAKYVDQARDVFNRVTTLGISTKKMKSFFKRFVEFETKYGNDVSINEAKQKAIDYVEVELKRQLTDS